MLFNSFEFMIFLPITLIAYWITPAKYRWATLLVASYYFYMSWNVYLVFLIFTTTVISYLSGIIIQKYESKAIKKTAMLMSIITSLGILFFFKYFNFLSASTIGILNKFGMNLHSFWLDLILPIGISFYTFQTLSYSIDVYRGDIKAEKHFGYYSLFVSFFPQLVAGPIERPQNLLPQLKKHTKPNKENIISGLQYMLVGFFKKVVVADMLAIYVNIVFNDVQNANGLTIVIATIMFSVQILCDFDGYTKIAIGVAKLMNIQLMKNFDRPYSALSIKEFWARWHISLSSWFRDYVYIPLGGNRCKKSRHLFNLFLTFLLSGVWHGANWNFVLWGALHGIYLIIGNIGYKPKQQLYAKFKIDSQSKLSKLVRNATTYILVCFAWIFFRANNINDLGLLLRKLFLEWRFSFSFIENSLNALGITPLILVAVGLMLAMIYYLEEMLTSDNSTLICKNNSSMSIVRKSIYMLTIFCIIFAWSYVSAQVGYQNSFIYFQF